MKSAEDAKNFLDSYGEEAWEIFLKKFISVEDAMKEHPTILIRRNSIVFANLETNEATAFNFEGLKK